MINFIKQLLGFGTSQETVKEIVTPPVLAPVVTASTPADNVTLQATYVEPAKPIIKTNKVKAISETGADAVKAATAPKPANKQRKPYRGNKPKAQPAKPQAKQAPKPAKKK